MDDSELLAIFSGRVQGVFFRASVKKLADRMDISGYAKNLQDGRVEVCAQGKKELLIEFLQQIRVQARFARVDQVESHFQPPVQSIDGFAVY